MKTKAGRQALVVGNQPTDHAGVTVSIPGPRRWSGPEGQEEVGFLVEFRRGTRRREPYFGILGHEWLLSHQQVRAEVAIEVEVEAGVRVFSLKVN